MLLATGGLWGVLNAEDVSREVALGSGASDVCADLCEKAKGAWQSEESKRDDISALLIQFTAMA